MTSNTQFETLFSMLYKSGYDIDEICKKMIKKAIEETGFDNMAKKQFDNFFAIINREFDVDDRFKKKIIKAIETAGFCDNLTVIFPKEKLKGPEPKYNDSQMNIWETKVNAEMSLIMAHKEKIQADEEYELALKKKQDKLEVLDLALKTLQLAEEEYNKAFK